MRALRWLVAAAVWLTFAGGAVAHAQAETEGEVAQQPPAAHVASSRVDEGPVVVTTRIRPDPSHVGDLLDLEVVAAYPRDIRVNLPSVLDFSPLHLVSVEESEPEGTGEGVRKTFTIRLQCFEVGDASVPAFSLTYVTADGEVHSIEVPAQPFVVASLLANETDPQRKGEDPPISLEYPNTLAEIIAYSVLATLFAALLVWLLARRFARREKAIVLPPPIPPHELALRALEELEGGELLDKGLWADYYLQLTEIAKGYLEGRFGVEALDRTTEEIRIDLMRDPERVEPLSVDEIIRFLQGCDLVKFARFRPDADEAKDALGEVRVMVERSVPRPERAAAPKAVPASADQADAPTQAEAAAEAAAPDREARP